MTDQLPAPLVPAEVDLRDFGFMPLDVVRLRDSGLTAKASGDEFRAAVLLWCAAWHQQPAASLPDDDDELANLCGYGRARREWSKIREGALRGFIKCGDGRLYHPMVATKANEAWLSKQAQRARTEAARKAREAARQSQSQALSQSGEKYVTDTATESKGQGQGQGQGLEEKTSSSSSAGPTEGDGGKGSDKAGRTPTIPCPYHAIVGAYHDALPSLPAVRLTSGKTWEKREKAMRTLWGWVLSSRKTDGTPRAETAEQALDWIASYFRRASENDFVMGRTQRSAEHGNWVADFDFLLSDKGMRQVIEKTGAGRSAA